ncbi:hypothetical protein Acsp03_64310 [Actinomadura sp. NBRC 104412]|uniref:hypothetical protein n=1 Tax=Actinomadura sp. NBRC 104412 TaxID=3032203 RepID=UPI0024A4BCFB|nr:hypothetical protein [Actinomadura sp. NBRC 104412]GLZ08965.1 hypothetical protein Acsp03_64310 [Actinomadura sp. NBRC 104412]
MSGMDEDVARLLAETARQLALIAKQMIVTVELAEEVGVLPSAGGTAGQRRERRHLHPVKDE